MDFITVGLSFIAGALVSYILFARSSMLGKFEAMIWAGLGEGKRVIISMDANAYIFEMSGNKLRITRGIVDYMEELPYGNVVDDNGTNQSDNVSDSSVSDLETK